MTSTGRRLLALLVGAALCLMSGAPLAQAAGTPTPGSSVAESNAAADLLGIDRSPAPVIVSSVISGSPVCGPTDFTAYASGLARALSPAERSLLAAYPQLLTIPTIDAIINASPSDSRYDLRPDYRHTVSKTFSRLQGFWDIPSADIQLVAMHGSVLKDPTRVAKALQLPIPGYGLTPAAAQQAAAEISTATRAGLFGGGTNPLLTLNAFAFTPALYPFTPMQGLPDKIIVGDGIVDALHALGVGDVGPQVVLAHEYGHHVQFRTGIYASPLPPPEASRRTELMADAFSAYFSVHARGLSFNTKRVLLAERTFFDLGDCAYDNPEHHGTPDQRMRSVAWAAGVANSARPQGKILPARAFDALFERELPVLVGP